MGNVTRRGVSGRRLRQLTAAGALIVAAIAAPVAQQPATSIMPQQPAPAATARWNKIIERLEQGQPAQSSELAKFIDMEHGAFSMDRLEAALVDLAKDKDANGRPRLTPYVRIPHDADEDTKWVIKQVIDAGVLAIMLPHVETKADVIKVVRAMRYPPQRGWSNAKYPEPRGQRGGTPVRAAKYWGMENPVDYAKRADVWPLNPDGELFLVAQIETVDGVKNIREILDAPGLGAILLSPHDLTFSLGVVPERLPLTASTFPPELEAAYESVLKVCSAQKTVICGAALAPERLRKQYNVRF